MAAALHRWFGPGQIPQKPRPRPHRRHKQVIPRPGARHIQQVPLGVVHLLKVRFVGDLLDPRLKRHHLVIDGGDDYRPELQPLGQVHRHQHDLPRLGVDAGGGCRDLEPRLLDRASGARDLLSRPNEDPDFFWGQALGKSRL